MKIPAAVPLNALRAFESAARHGNFVRAGEELNVTPAAISHRVKNLEAALGVAMFLRLTRGIQLTEAGKRFSARISQALQLIEQGVADIGDLPVQGKLMVSMPESFAALWFVPRLHRLRESVPGIELAIESDSGIASLRGGPVDIGIRFGRGDYADLISEFLCGDAVSVLTTLELARVPARRHAREIIKTNVLLEDYRTSVHEPWMTWQPWLREAGLQDDAGRGRIRFSNSGLAVDACTRNAGLCIGRISLTYEQLRNRQLQPLFPWRSTEFGYYLVMPPAAAENPRAIAFRRWLLDEINLYAHEILSSTGFTLAMPAKQ